MRANKRWTTDEHSTLEQTIKESISKGEALSKAYKQAAFKTGRTVEACKWRWKNVIQTAKETKKENTSNLKIANFPKRQNTKVENLFSDFSQTPPYKNVEDFFGAIFGKDIFSTTNQTQKSVSSLKDHDISNLTSYPMFGNNYDHAVVDEKTKEAYLVCSLSEEVYLCSCQRNLFTNSTCKHVRKVKSEKRK